MVAQSPLLSIYEHLVHEGRREVIPSTHAELVILTPDFAIGVIKDQVVPQVPSGVDVVSHLDDVMSFFGLEQLSSPCPEQLGAF